MRDARNAIHVTLVAVLVWLSIAVQLPGTIDSITFSGFARFGGAEAWSYVMLATGMVGLVGLVSKSKWANQASVFLLANAHIVVAWCFYIGSAPEYVVSPGAGTYGLIAALGYYLLWRRFYA